MARSDTIIQMGKDEDSGYKVKVGEIRRKEERKRTRDYHGLSWTIMDYHGLSWTIMDYHRLSWTIKDSNGQEIALCREARL